MPSPKEISFQSIVEEVNASRNGFFSKLRHKHPMDVKEDLEDAKLKFLKHENVEKFSEARAALLAAHDASKATTPSLEELRTFWESAKKLQTKIEKIDEEIAAHKETRSLCKEAVKALTVDALFGAVPEAVKAVNKGKQAVLAGFFEGALTLGGVDETLVQNLIGLYHLKSTIDDWRKNPMGFLKSLAENLTDELDIATFITAFMKSKSCPALPEDIERALDRRVSDYQKENDEKMFTVAVKMAAEVQAILKNGILPEDKNTLSRVEYLMGQLREYQVSIEKRIEAVKKKCEKLKINPKEEITGLEQLKENIAKEFNKITIWQEVPSNFLAREIRKMLSNSHVMVAMSASKSIDAYKKNNSDVSEVNHIQFLMSLHRQASEGKKAFHKRRGFARVNQAIGGIVTEVKTNLSAIIDVDVSPYVMKVDAIAAEVSAGVYKAEFEMASASLRLFHECDNILKKPLVDEKNSIAVHADFLERRKALVERMQVLQSLCAYLPENTSIKTNQESIDVYCKGAGDPLGVWHSNLSLSDKAAQAIVLLGEAELLSAYTKVFADKSDPLTDQQQFVLDEMRIRFHAGVLLTYRTEYEEVLKMHQLLTATVVSTEEKKSETKTERAPTPTEIQKEDAEKIAAKIAADTLLKNYEESRVILVNRIKELSTGFRGMLQRAAITFKGKEDRAELVMLQDKLTVADRLNRDYQNNPLGFSAERENPDLAEDEKLAIDYISTGVGRDYDLAKKAVSFLKAPGSPSLARTILMVSGLPGDSAKKMSEEYIRNLKAAEESWLILSHWVFGEKVRPTQESLNAVFDYAFGITRRVEVVEKIIASGVSSYDGLLDQRAIYLSEKTPRELDQLIAKIKTIEEDGLPDISQQLNGELKSLKAEIAISMMERLVLMSEGKIPDLVYATGRLGDAASMDAYTLTPEKVRDYYDFIYQHADESTIFKLESELPPSADLFLNGDKSYDKAVQRFETAITQLLLEKKQLASAKDKALGLTVEQIALTGKAIRIAKELDQSYRAHKRQLPESDKPKNLMQEQKAFEHFLKSSAAAKEKYDFLTALGYKGLPDLIQKAAKSKYISSVNAIYDPVRLIEKISSQLEERHKAIDDAHSSRVRQHRDKASTARLATLNAELLDTEERIARLGSGFFNSIKNFFMGKSKEQQVLEDKVAALNKEILLMERGKTVEETWALVDSDLEIQEVTASDLLEKTYQEEKRQITIEDTVFQEICRETAVKMKSGVLSEEDHKKIIDFVKKYATREQKEMFLTEASPKRAFIAAVREHQSIETLERLVKQMETYKAGVGDTRFHQTLLAFIKGELDPRSPENKTQWDEFEKAYFVSERAARVAMQSAATGAPLTEAEQKEIDDEMQQFEKEEPFTVNEWLKRLLVGTQLNPKHVELYLSEKIMSLVSAHFQTTEAASDALLRKIKSLADLVSYSGNFLEKSVSAFRELEKENHNANALRLIELLPTLLRYHDDDSKKEFLSQYVRDFLNPFLSNEKKITKNTIACLEKMMTLDNAEFCKNEIEKKLLDNLRSGNAVWNPLLATFIEAHFSGSDLAAQYCLLRLRELCHQRFETPEAAKAALTELKNISSIQENLYGTQLMRDFIDAELVADQWGYHENAIPPSYVSEMIVAHFGEASDLGRMHTVWLYKALEAMNDTEKDYEEFENGETVILDVIDSQDDPASLHYSFYDVVSVRNLFSEAADKTTKAEVPKTDAEKMALFLSAIPDEQAERLENSRYELDRAKSRLFESEEAGRIDLTLPINEISALMPESETVIKLANSAFLKRIETLLFDKAHPLSTIALDNTDAADIADRLMGEADLRVMVKTYLQLSGLDIKADDTDEFPSDPDISALETQALQSMNRWLLLPQAERTEEMAQYYVEEIARVEKYIHELDKKLKINIEISSESHFVGVAGAASATVYQTMVDRKALAQKTIQLTAEQIAFQKERLVAMKANMEKLIPTRHVDDPAVDVEMTEIAKKDPAASSAVSAKGYVYEKNPDQFYRLYLLEVQMLADTFITQKSVGAITDGTLSADQRIERMRFIEAAMITPVVVLDERHVNPIIAHCDLSDDISKTVLKDLLLRLATSDRVTEKDQQDVAAIFSPKEAPLVITDYVSACHHAAILRTKMDAITIYFEFEKAVSLLLTDPMRSVDIDAILQVSESLRKLEGITDRLHDRITECLDGCVHQLSQGKPPSNFSALEKLVEAFGSEEQKERYQLIQSVEKMMRAQLGRLNNLNALSVNADYIQSVFSALEKSTDEKLKKGAVDIAKSLALECLKEGSAQYMLMTLLKNPDVMDELRCDRNAVVAILETEEKRSGLESIERRIRLVSPILVEKAREWMVSAKMDVAQFEKIVHWVAKYGDESSREKLVVYISALRDRAAFSLVKPEKIDALLKELSQPSNVADKAATAVMRSGVGGGPLGSMFGAAHKSRESTPAQESTITSPGFKH